MIKKRNVVSVFALLVIGLGIIFLQGCTKDPVELRSTTYDLNVEDVLGVSGTVKFTETSATIVTIDIALTGVSGGDHPAQLCKNTVVEGGIVKVILNPVDANGKSSTVINTMSYAELIAYNGFVRVLKSDLNANIILAQGDIGGNVLTTTNKSYPLATLDNYGVSGNALFQKRLNGNTLITLTLSGTIAGDYYPVSLNLGSVASVGGGPVVKTLQSVNGTTGKSYTNVTDLNSGVAITYDNWMVYDGYINVYQSAAFSNVIISQGNIGSN